MSNIPTALQVKIVDDTGEKFVGTAVAISSLNDQGTFDIMPEHINFISLISQYVILHQENGKQQKFEVESGVLRCFSSEVEIYLGVGKY